MNTNHTKKISYIDEYVNFQDYMLSTMKEKRFISAKRVGSMIKITFWDTPFFNGSNNNDRKNFEKKKDSEKEKSSLHRARQMVFDLVETNLKAHGEKAIFLTLTFKDKNNSLDIETANIFLTDFFRKLKYYLGFPALYVCVPEFQKRGTPHYHIIFFNLPFIFVSKETRKKFSRKTSKFNFNWNDIWIHGDVNVKLIKNEYTNKNGKVIKNGCAAYMSKYLSKKFQDKRLYGKKTYSASRGLIRPYKMFSEINLFTSDKIMHHLITVFGMDEKISTNFINGYDEFIMIEGKDKKENIDFIKRFSGRRFQINSDRDFPIQSPDFDI